MPVIVDDALKLSNENNCDIMLCKLALEHSKQDIKLAKETLKRWTRKKVKQDKVSMYGYMYSYFDKETGAASLVEIKTAESYIIKLTEFKKLVGHIAYDVAHNGELTTSQQEKEIFEKHYNTKLSLYVLQFKKSTPQSLLTTYNHKNKIGVIIETRAATNEAFMHEKFRRFSFNCAMHIAAYNPLVIKETHIKQATVQEKIKEYEAELALSGKEVKLWEEIIGDKIIKWCQANSLLTQKFLFNERVTIFEEMVALSKELDGNIEIINFVRFSL